MEPFGHVRKMELFDAMVRKKELVVSMVRRNGAFWTWSGRWSFLMQLSEDGSYLLI
jgi:hypothetical protein